MYFLRKTSPVTKSETKLSHNKHFRPAHLGLTRRPPMPALIVRSRHPSHSRSHSTPGVVHANVGHKVTPFNDGRTAVSYHFSTYERCDNQPQHKKTGKTPRPWWPSRPRPLQQRGVDGSAQSSMRATRPWYRVRSRTKN